MLCAQKSVMRGVGVRVCVFILTGVIPQEVSFVNPVCVC